MGDSRWTDQDVDALLGEVREALLTFLRARTRLEWFKAKLRWRLTRRYVWPGSPDGLKSLLDETVERDPGVEAFLHHVESQSQRITDAIERYNYAVRRNMEAELGSPLSALSTAQRAELQRRRITFQGIHDELLRLGRTLGDDARPEEFGELLSLRLAILDESARQQVFGEVCAKVAAEAADRAADMAPAERDAVAVATELRLRVLDRYHVARLLADSYEEARRLMNFDKNLARYAALAQQPGGDPAKDLGRSIQLGALRKALLTQLGYLELLYPKTAGTHTTERRALRPPKGAPRAR